MSLNCLTLTDAESATIQAIIGKKSSPAFFGARSCDRMPELDNCVEALPTRVREAIAEIRMGESGTGALMIAGFRIPHGLPDTPTGIYEYIDGSEVGTEGYLCLLSRLLGPAISFEDWHGGAKIQNLYPLPDRRNVQCAANCVYLEMHTETAFRPNTPYFLILLCLREGREPVYTILCDLREIVNAMAPEAKKVLGSPSFCFAIKDDHGGRTEPKPIETLHSGHRRLNYAEALMGIDEPSREVLAELRHQIQKKARLLQLKAGDAMIINNLYMVHGRTAFEPRFDGTDRWLQRLLVGSNA